MPCVSVCIECARAEYDYKRSGMLGRSFVCRQNGNYEKVQCLGSVCYCVNEITGIKRGRLMAHISKKTTLNCDVIDQPIKNDSGL